MNSLEYIGIHSDGRSKLDEHVLEEMRDYIKLTADMVRDKGFVVTRITLATFLRTDRQRVSRICKTLGITDIFDKIRK